MNIALIARSTLLTVRGGDTIQIQQTVRHLPASGISADIIPADQPIDYKKYDLLHFFNLTRPADILRHIHKTAVPFILSPNLVDYSEFDKYHRRGLSGMAFRCLPGNMIEYLKTLARAIRGNDRLPGLYYLWNGQDRSIKYILGKTALVLPNSRLEYESICSRFHVRPQYAIVPNGIDPRLFRFNSQTKKDPRLVLCVARIEGIKNHLGLIRALNNSAYRLLIIGSPAPNQQHYYNTCRKAAAGNIIFKDHLGQRELVTYYQRAKVHVLPSWFETCGLSSLEAGAMGCNLVITDKGYTREYFADDAFYCDPASQESIFGAIEKAARSACQERLREKILAQYTWQQAAAHTAAAYRQAMETL